MLKPVRAVRGSLVVTVEEETALEEGLVILTSDPLYENGALRPAVPATAEQLAAATEAGGDAVDPRYTGWTRAQLLEEISKRNTDRPAEAAIADRGPIPVLVDALVADDAAHGG
ncbi:hypothetical protein GCM10022215_24160 [Nocardioides fonticola]|uniref:Uncharacterized protein n=1 Tax=Nocardioides fonticola TaxID=450363 RepID=A0ABP7XK79_9ACTN